MAEREGFEPPVPLRVRLILSQVHSTGLCHLSALFSINYKLLWPLTDYRASVVILGTCSRSTADAVCEGARCAYLGAIWAVLCPKSSPPCVNPHRP